jgi:hypothetical protein
LNTHSVNAGTYRPDGPLSTKNTQKSAIILFYQPCFKQKEHRAFSAVRCSLILPGQTGKNNCFFSVPNAMHFSMDDANKMAGMTKPVKSVETG